MTEEERERILKLANKPVSDVGRSIMWLALMVAALLGFCAFGLWFSESNRRADRDACKQMRCPESTQRVLVDERCLCTTEAKP